MRRWVLGFLALAGYAGLLRFAGAGVGGLLLAAYQRDRWGEAGLLVMGVLAAAGLARLLGLPGRSGALWVGGLEAANYLLSLALAMARAVTPRPAFGAVFVPFGWRYLVLGYAALALLLLFLSALWVGVKNRLTGRRQSLLAFYGYALLHLFLWSLVLLVFYPVVQIVAASFDPTNNLFSFRRVESPFLLIRAKVLPDFARVSLANYRALVQGVRVPPYQWGLLGLSAALLLAALLVGAWGRIQDDLKKRELAGRLLFLFAAALFLLVLLVHPGQFHGLGTETKFLLWVRNTLLLSGATGLLAVALTAPAGYAFARFSFPGRYPTLLAFIFVQMFPGFLALIAIYYLLSALDLLNTFTGLLLAYSGGIVSFGSWVYKGYVESLGRSLEEAAYIDGATRFQAFLRIVLPISAPIFVFIFLLQFVATYSEFILANLVLTGVEKWTVGVGLYSFTTGQFQTKWGIFAAASVLGSLPIVLIFYGFQQYFVSGYTAGAVKE